MRRPQKKRQKTGRNARRPAASNKGDGEPRRAEATRLQLKRLDGHRFALQPPECARDRQDDLDDVTEMIAAGELEIARDELLYLVSDCRGFLEAHNRLGELALEEGDVPLARGPGTVPHRPRTARRGTKSPRAARSVRSGRGVHPPVAGGA